MKKCNWTLGIAVFFLLSFFNPFVSAQNADEIIKNHLEKSGGIQHWKSLNSIILIGDAVLGVEQSFPLKIYHRRPYQKKVVFMIEGKELLNEGYDGKDGWTYNEISERNEKVKNYQPDSFESDLLDYNKKGFSAEYKGVDKTGNKECHKVELTKNVNKITYCFATSDYSLIWEENKEERLNYYDYKKFNGLEFATRIIGQPNDGGEYVLQFNNIQINPHIEDKEFRF